ncbi:MAG: hypothetical protein KC457_19520 [Myxococcales bacterium]|nr:hypothetical protein [Myxococcales bacterium]
MTEPEDGKGDGNADAEKGDTDDPSLTASSSGVSEITNTIDDDTTEQERAELMLAVERRRREGSAAISGSLAASAVADSDHSGTGSSKRIPTVRANTKSGATGAKSGQQPRFYDPLRILAAAATGASMWISAPNMDIWWLAFVGWVPLLWAIHGRPVKHAFYYGWISGFVSVFVGFFWMSELLTRFAGFAMPGAAGVTALFALWLGLQWALPAAISNFLVARTGRSTLLIFPMAWAAIEFVLPSIFPVYMALSWAWQPLWIQTAEIGGAMTVSFVMVAINAAIWETIRGYVDDGKIPVVAGASLAAWLIGVPDLRAPAHGAGRRPGRRRA